MPDRKPIHLWRAGYDGDDIMAAITAEMERRGMTAHKLAQLITPPPTRESLYEYMRGDHAPSTPVASRLMAALGLKIVRAR